MTLFWYILKDYLKYVLGTIVLTVFLFVLFDFINKATKDFADYHPSTATIVRFYAVQVPGQVVQALPIAALLASVISMILLSRTNEITAMRAAGMGPLQIGLPLAAGGMLLSLLALILGELVVPQLAQKMHFIEQVEIQGQKRDQLASGAKWLRNGQSLINFQDFDQVTQTLLRLQIIDLRPNFRPIQSLEADKAVYSPDTHQWLLQGVRLLVFKRNGVLDHIETPAKAPEISLPVEPKKLQKDWRQPRELSMRELSDLIAKGERAGSDTLPYKVDLQGKIAYPFAAFVVSLIGLKFGYKSERATETAKGVLLAFFVGISYWFIMSAGRALGLRGDLPPIVAAWMSNVVILVLIGTDWWASRRTS